LSGRARRLAGPLVLLLVLLPALHLAYRTLVGDLGTDPVETLARDTGIWALRFLLLALLVTPLRRALGWSWLVKHRRTLGVASFAYATVHLLVYLVIDQGLALGFIAEDVAEHPWVLIGVTTWLMLLPLAVTSTTGWVRRLGGRRWQALHRLAYLCAIGGVAHYYLAVKQDVRLPLVYAAVAALLLGYRVWMRAARRAARVAAEG
jgi:sulfoxide reductase heme-binding subunit YedZ